MPPRLKSLELHGYKTFPSRTTFEFAPTITAVVGPNGSGKSNIADAVRWVLGEQTYSLLRGKRTEDMIFAGSEHRPRAGMASATITFDNEDGWLPIDFSEVSVRRRAYRDGKNEYLINGQRVRLKDITELLASCGLGERTYTVIGQGLVDSALSLKAEARRTLFEEAAGIGLYRKRREAALRRLDATRRNLERVQDILAELEPRLRSLERQARRARQYRQVKTDLKELLRVWYGYHWHAYQQELHLARAHARQSAEELQALQNEHGDLETDLAETRAQITALRDRINGWHHDMARLHTDSESLGRALAVADERARALAETREETRAELTALETELAAHEERLQTAQTEHATRLAEAEEAGERARSIQADLEARETRRATLQHREAAARQTLADLSDQLAETRARQSQFGERREQLADRRGELAGACERARSQTADARQRLELAESACTRAIERQTAAQDRLAAHERQIEEQKARLAELAQRLGQLGAEEARLLARDEVLAQAERELDGYAAGIRTLLAAAREGRLSGPRRTLSQTLDVPAEIELAIAAALGKSLDAVILDPDADLDAVLAHFDRPDSGQASLLPLARLLAGEPLRPFPDPDVLGVAAGLVSPPADLRPALDLLLGQTLVVRDRRAARRLLPTLPPGAAAVTLAGEVFHASGLILAGRPETGASSLTRHRERRELAEKLSTARANRARVADSSTALETALADLRAERANLATDLDRAQSLARDATEARDAARLAAERAKQQLSIRREGLAELEDREKAIDAEEAALDARRKDLLERQARTRATLAEIARELSEVDADDLARQAAHWQTRSAVARRAVADSEARLADLRRARDAARARVDDRKARAGRLAREIQTLNDSVADHRQRERQLRGEIEALQALIEPAENGLRASEAELQRIESRESASRARLRVAEREHARSQLESNRRQDALESLRSQIEDDFGLVAFDYASDVTGPTPLPLGDLVEKLATVEVLPDGMEESLNRRRLQLRRMGAINPEAPVEYDEVKERREFLTAQVSDLNEAQARLHEVIAELDLMIEQRFLETFDRVAIEFSEAFTRLFGGGSARLVLTDPQELTTTGIDIQARLPGRRPQSLALLSGGERSLTASALVFALLKVSPPPFCLLDEVDAALDESNVGRFRDVLRELSENTQFIVITHNRGTVQAADLIYGITMGKDTASQVMGLKLEEVAGKLATA